MDIYGYKFVNIIETKPLYALDIYGNKLVNTIET